MTAKHGEFTRIAEIARRLALPSTDVVLGIGDDAAILKGSPHAQVLSVDAQVEHVHFARNLLPMTDIGFRAVVAALSDLAAMGAKPRAALVSLIGPHDLAEEHLYEVADGIADASRRYLCPVIGGNLAAGPSLSITTTVIGHAPEKPLTRAGAQPGDGIFVTGDLGGAALGLALLQAGRPELSAYCVKRWRRPQARIEQGAALAGVAHSAIDISDGLLQDGGHLATASRVGLEIHVKQLPLHRDVREKASALGLDAIHLALCGGEDYELLFTAPPNVTPPVSHRIGTVVATPGVSIVDGSGRRISTPPSLGFDHFRRA